MSATDCERFSEARARVVFTRGGPCGSGFADELELAAPRDIGLADRNAECRLVLPRLIVTNGHQLKIVTRDAVETAAGGTRIVAFRPREVSAAGPGAPGRDAVNADPGQSGASGGNGESGQSGNSGRAAGLVVIEADRLIGALAIENAGEPGGRGGTGGRGGQGGYGGPGPDAVVTSGACQQPPRAGSQGGNGGAGGSGGTGGAGGNGGDVSISVGRALGVADRLTVSAKGGSGGAGGPGGFFGLRGRGGHPGKLELPCTRGDAGEGPAGVDGARGAVGLPGTSGRAGAITVKAGSIVHSRRYGQDQEVRIP